jgi:hypothetical protein
MKKRMGITGMRAAPRKSEPQKGFREEKRKGTHRLPRSIPPARAMAGYTRLRGSNEKEATKKKMGAQRGGFEAVKAEEREGVKREGLGLACL